MEPMKNSPKKRCIPLKIFLILLVVGAIVFALKPLRIRLFGFSQKDIVMFDETVPFFTASYYEQYGEAQRWNPSVEEVKQAEKVALSCLRSENRRLYRALNQFKLQFFGVVEGDKKVILVNGINQYGLAIEDDWENEPITTHVTSWRNYFKARVDLESKQCLGLYLSPFNFPHPEQVLMNQDFFFNPEDIVVFTDDTPFYKDGRPEEKWAPTNEQIESASRLLIECIKENTNGLYDRMGFYQIQYFPMIKEEKEVVMTNASLPALFEDEQLWKRSIHAPDSTSTYAYRWFQTELDLENQSCNGIYDRFEPLSGHTY